MTRTTPNKGLDMTSTCQVTHARDTPTLCNRSGDLAFGGGVRGAIQAAEQTAHPPAVRAAAR